MLRVYIRDRDAAFREQKLSILLKKSVLVPEFYFIGEYQLYRFAISEYIKGISLRDLLLSQKQYDLESIMIDVGLILSKIRLCTGQNIHDS